MIRRRQSGGRQGGASPPADARVRTLLTGRSYWPITPIRHLQAIMASYHGLISSCISRPPNRTEGQQAGMFRNHAAIRSAATPAAKGSWGQSILFRKINWFSPALFVAAPTLQREMDACPGSLLKRNSGPLPKSRRWPTRKSAAAQQEPPSPCWKAP